MDTQNNSFDFNYYLISLISAIFVGIDVAMVSYLFTYTTIGVAGGIFIAVCGGFLNTYVYHEAGPATISHLMKVKSDGWSIVIDIISILGGLLIFLFTLSAYKDLALTTTFISFWFSPLIVCVMAAAYFIATFALNKSGLLKLLEARQENAENDRSFFIQLVKWVIDFRTFITNKWNEGLITFCSEVVIPLFVAIVVTYAYTHVFTIGALAFLANWQYQLFWQSLVYLSSAAFFIGELYFNCEQNISFMKNYNDLFDSKKMGIFCLVFVIFANAVANAFIALEGPLVMSLTLWGGLRFFCGGIQSFCTMSARCILEFSSWESFFGKEPKRLAFWTLLVLDILLMINLVQVPYVLPIYLNPLSYCMIFFLTLIIMWQSDVPEKNNIDFPHNIPQNSTNNGGGNILPAIKKGTGSTDQLDRNEYNPSLADKMVGKNFK